MFAVLFCLNKHYVVVGSGCHVVCADFVCFLHRFSSIFANEHKKIIFVVGNERKKKFSLSQIDIIEFTMNGNENKTKGLLFFGDVTDV